MGGTGFQANGTAKTIEPQPSIPLDALAVEREHRPAELDPRRKELIGAGFTGAEVREIEWRIPDLDFKRLKLLTDDPEAAVADAFQLRDESGVPVVFHLGRRLIFVLHDSVPETTLAFCRNTAMSPWHGWHGFPPDLDRRGEVQVVGLEFIEGSPYNPRTHQERTEFERMKADVLKHGIQQPLEVCRGADKVLRILSGHRRTLAAEELSLEAVPVVIDFVALPKGDELLRVLKANQFVAPMPPLDAAEAYRQLAEERRWDAETLAKELGISPKTIKDGWTLLADLRPDVQRQVNRGRISISMGLELARIQDPKVQFEIAEKVIANEIGRADIRDAVDAALGRAAEDEPTARRGPVPKYKRVFYLGDGNTVEFKTRRGQISDDQVLLALEKIRLQIPVAMKGIQRPNE